MPRDPQRMPLPMAAQEGSSALAMLKQGEMSAEQFLLTKVEQCLANLVGFVDQEQLAFLKELARESLGDDPVLSSLVHRILQEDILQEDILQEDILQEDRVR